MQHLGLMLKQLMAKNMDIDSQQLIRQRGRDQCPIVDHRVKCCVICTVLFPGTFIDASHREREEQQGGTKE